jgi:uncharacterized repeat protein (TIGR03847 family)
MPQDDIVLDPVDHITIDALGKPGQRIFYIQAFKGPRKITLLIEKIQLQSLLEGFNEFLDEIQKRFPEITEPEVSFQENDMQIHLPVDPLFRAGDMGLAYDETRDLACIFVREAQPSGEEGRIVRFWCSRAQLIAVARWGAIIIQRGRPICPQCGQPIETEGHFCPKKNGHKHGKK